MLFSGHHKRECIMLTRPFTDDVNLDYLIKLVSKVFTP